MEKKNNNLIGVIGDMHMKDNLSYADYISDGRAQEKKDILSFIVESFKDCNSIVFLGDNFDGRNNSSETNREFVEFLESFGKKELYLISGNHEKKGNGKTAIDFLAEVKKPNWHIFTRPADVKIGELEISLLPNMLRAELEVETNEEAVKMILKDLRGGHILFAHHAITGTSFNGIKTDTLQEIVLPKDKLEKKYKLVVGGHIHNPQQTNRTLVAGNLFTTVVGEKERFIWKIDEEMGVTKIKVPAREIHKLEDPTLKQITELPKNSIAKIVVTDKKIDLDELKVVAAGLDAYLLVEDYPSERTKIHIEDGAMDFSIESLLNLYSKAKNINLEKLLKGLELISK